MRRANNTGTIVKLKGNRYKPYAAYIHGEKIINELSGSTYRRKHAIGYFATRKEAQDALQTYIMQPYDLTKQNMTFIEIWNIIKDNLDISKSRQNGYDGAIKYLAPIKDMPLKDIRTVHLQTIIDDCPVGSATKTNIKTVMNKVYNYGLENDIIFKNYADFVSFDKDETQIERVIYTDDEVKRLWLLSNDWIYQFILILLYTGLRPIELINLKKEHVNMQDGYFDVVARGKRNGKKISKTVAGVRVVPIHNKIMPIFEKLMARDGEWLIQTDRGCKVQYQNYVDRSLPKVLEYLGVEHYLYDTRHTWASKAKEVKMDEFYKKAMFGHKQESLIDDVYTHAVLDTLKKEMNKIEY